MTTISQKQSSLAVAALAFIAGVALSVPNSVSAANLATYDFEFKFADTTTASGFITFDKDDKSESGSNLALYSSDYSFDYSVWSQPKWVDFSLAYLGTTYTKADATPKSSFVTYDYPNDSLLYFYHGSYLNLISLIRSDGKSLFGQADATNYTVYGIVNGDDGTLFTLTPRSKAVPVPGFAFGIVAAGGWLASKQLRRKTQTAKQSVSA